MAAAFDPEMRSAILKLFEWYFSDRNLQRDKFLQDRLAQNECTAFYLSFSSPPVCPSGYLEALEFGFSVHDSE